MTSAEAESGLVTEKNSFTNENTALTSHYYDPEICKLLQELSVDTKAARKSSEVRIFVLIYKLQSGLSFVYHITHHILYLTQ